MACERELLLAQRTPRLEWQMSMRARILCAIGLAAVTAGYTPPAAQRLRATGHVTFHVAPAGEDAGNDCLVEARPCRTVQAAVSRAMLDWDFAGYEPFIRLAPGVYPRGASVAGQLVGAHTVNIVGQQSEDATQNCTLEQAQQVTVHPSAGEIAFNFEDLAIGVVRCMTIEGAGVAFGCRQTPAVDIAFIRFGAGEALSIAIGANDSCGLNVAGSIWLGNDVFQLFTANNHSRVTVGATIIALQPVTVTHFANSAAMSEIEFRTGAVSVAGPLAAKESMVYAGGAIVTNGFAIPGGVRQFNPQKPGFRVLSTFDAFAVLHFPALGLRLRALHPRASRHARRRRRTPIVTPRPPSRRQVTS